MTSSKMEIPSEIETIISKLDSADQETLKKYIGKLQGVEEETAQSSGTSEETDDHGDEAPFPPVYESGDDFETATSFKQEAADLKADNKWDEALEKYTAAILAAEPSALLYANRAIALLKLNRPRAAERDCTLALNINPDSAKALRGRGKARKELGKWEEALKDLSAAQQIDFDENTVDDLKELSELRLSHEKEEAQKRIEEEEKKKKRAEEIRNAQEEAKKEAEEDRARAAAGGSGGGMPGGMGGMPGMGGMGGMPGMGGMGGMPGMGGGGGGGGMPDIMQMLMSDPELAAGMQNPKVMEAFQNLLSQPGGAAGLMSNPAKIQELMSDPEVGPFLQKLMAKMGGGAMGGMPGGFGGMGNPSGDSGHDDDIDLGDLPDLE